MRCQQQGHLLYGAQGWVSGEPCFWKEEGMALAQAKHVQVLPDTPLPVGSFHTELGEGPPSLLAWSQGFGGAVV